MVIDPNRGFGWNFFDFEPEDFQTPAEYEADLAIEEIFEMIHTKKDGDITRQLSIIAEFFGLDMPKKTRINIKIEEEK